MYQYQHSVSKCGFLSCDSYASSLETPSSDGRYLVVKWPEWLDSITGNGTGPVVSYTLQGLAQLDSSDWQNLVTMEQQPLSNSARTSSTANWFTHVAEGCFIFCLFQCL